MAAAGAPGEVDVAWRPRALWWRNLVFTFPPVGVLAGIVGAMLVLAVPALSYGVIPGLIALAAALSAVHASTELSTYARRVRIGPGGLSLAYPKFTIEAPWSKWRPVSRKRMTGGIVLHTAMGRRTGYLVTAEQARHIRDLPGRPKWPEGEELFEALGPAPQATPPR